MMKLMSLEFALNTDVMTTVRLVTGGVCALVGFDLDSSEDCKVCVTESLLLLLHGGSKTARLSFERGDCLKITLEGEGTLSGEKTVEEEISVALLSALVDDLDIRKTDGSTKISFGFGRL